MTLFETCNDNGTRRDEDHIFQLVNADKNVYSKLLNLLKCTVNGAHVVEIAIIHKVLGRESINTSILCVGAGAMIIRLLFVLLFAEKNYIEGHKNPICHKIINRNFIMNKLCYTQKSVFSEFKALAVSQLIITRIFQLNSSIIYRLMFRIN